HAGEFVLGALGEKLPRRIHLPGLQVGDEGAEGPVGSVGSGGAADEGQRQDEKEPRVDAHAREPTTLGPASGSEMGGDVPRERHDGSPVQIEEAEGEAVRAPGGGGVDEDGIGLVRHGDLDAHEAFGDLAVVAGEHPRHGEVLRPKPAAPAGVLQLEGEARRYPRLATARGPGVDRDRLHGAIPTRSVAQIHILPPTLCGKPWNVSFSVSSLHRTNAPFWRPSTESTRESSSFRDGSSRPMTPRVSWRIPRATASRRA